MSTLSDNAQDAHNVHNVSSEFPLEHSVFSSSNSQLATQHGEYDALILEARLRQSLVTVRSLGKKGLRVAALETFANVPTFWSRWCQQAFICPTHCDAESYLWGLEQALERTGARVLITSEDANVELIRLHRELLEQRVRIALARDPALEIALNKERTLEIAGRLGLGIPRSVTVTGTSDVPCALREIGLPAVIKPIQSWVLHEQRKIGLKGKLVTTSDEAMQVVEDFMRLEVTTLFQQFLSGRREAVSFLYAHGRFYARFAQWAKRTAPPLGGTSVLRQSIAIPPDIGAQAERLVREIELEGYSEVEFRRDSAGKPYLMEINPRLSASVELAVRAGVDFPYLLYQWANEEHINQVTGYRVGSWMRYLRGDVATTVLALQQHGRPGVPPRAQTLRDFFLSFFVPMRYDYLDWRDPLPVLVTGVDFARYVSHVLKNSFSRSMSD